MGVLCSLPKVHRWVHYRRGKIPRGAVLAGHDQDGTPLYVGRAYHLNELLPAKVKPNCKAFVTWENTLQVIPECEVLVSKKVGWEMTRDGLIPPQSLVVSVDSSGEELYLGRAHYDGALLPAQVSPSRGFYIIHGCEEEPLNLPHFFQKLVFDEYEILVYL